MKKLVFTLLLLVLIVACGRKLPTTSSRNTRTVFRITSLKADNISEEITGNDEIHLLIWLVKDSLSTRFLLKEWQDSMVFHSTATSVSKNLSIQYPIDSFMFAKTSLLVLLIEVDTEEPFEARTEAVRKLLQEANYQYDDSLQTRISRKLADDDVLGMKFCKISQLPANPSGELLFSGMQLFDKYFYRLNYTLE